jgi:hypothetical protein
VRNRIAVLLAVLGLVFGGSLAGAKWTKTKTNKSNNKKSRTTISLR